MRLFCVFLLSGLLLSAYGQYNDPNYPIPASGYGSEGTHTVGVLSFPNPYFGTENIRVYYPTDISGPVPTLFYSHAYGGNFPSHISGLFQFVVKKGYAFVFVPYQTVGVSVENRYENLLEGFRKAARTYPSIIDTTKVGFMGHSFGGGATIATSYACFTQQGWGQNGRFIYPSAPWYAYNISQAELQAFPADTRMIMEVYDDDVVNDHRMAADIFRHINIPVDEKDFILVKSDTVNGYVYAAGHDLPTTYTAFDAMDYYAYYRLIDALCDYTFYGNPAGKAVALGNGNASQISMPAGLHSLVQTDTPGVSYPESRYGFPCSSFGNPRNEYCESSTDADELIGNVSLRAYPNPFRSHIFLETAQPGVYFSLLNGLGQPIYTGSALSEQDFSALPAGVYVLKIGRAGEVGYLKIRKE